MRGAVKTAPLALLILAVVIGGCAGKALEQRTTEGLTADQMFVYRVLQQNGREPTWEERQTWRDGLDQQISDYLNQHPEVANAFSVSKFRAERRASVGMTKEQVQILLGPPLGVATDAARIEKIARKYWPDIRDRATEAWLYPLGWNLYFAGDRLIDITQYRK
jgi:hypothetical protein